MFQRLIGRGWLRLPGTLALAWVLGAGGGCGRNGDSAGSESPSAGAGGGSSAGSAAGTAAGTGAGTGRGRGTGTGGARPAEHAVYSLIDNRLSAHRVRGGGFAVDAGSAGFVRYLRWSRSKLPWSIRGERDGTRVATMGGKTSSVTVPLAKGQTRGAIRVRGHSPTDQRLGLRINGARDKEVTTEIPAGWFTAELEAPEGTLVRGENELILFAAKGALDVAWIQVGGEARAGDALPPLHDAASSSLVLADGHGLAYYVLIPEAGQLVGDVVGDGCTVAVRAVPEQGAAVEGALAGAGSGVDLSGLAGKPVRLELQAAGCAEARLAGAALVVPGAAPKRSEIPRPKHIVFWVMDSLRADRVSVFVDGARAEVPVWASLVDGSAVFTQHYVQGNESKCSHASMWTSLYPVRHKMIPPSSKLSPKWTSVDEVAASAGLFTSGVSANGYVTPKRGFGTKWKKYRNHIHEGGGLNGEDIMGKALASLAGKENDPWFLYMGTIDTHVSWKAKEPWLSRYDTKPYNGRFKKQASGAEVGKIAAGSLKVDDRDVERIVALYDSNISYQDKLLGELVEWLKEKGIYEDTAIIITADHGDELLEDGRIGHGSSLRSSLVHVPLFIHYPRLKGPGRIAEGVEVIDVVPTIAELLGVEADPEWQGESLLGLIQGVGRGYPRLTMASLYENAHVGQLGPWKLRAARGSVRLYDMRDIRESEEVSAAHPFAVRMVADALWLLRGHNDAWRKATWGNPANVRPAFAAAMGE